MDDDKGRIERPLWKKFLDIFFDDDWATIKKNTWEHIIRPQMKQYAHGMLRGIVDEAFHSKASYSNQLGTSRSYNTTTSDFRSQQEPEKTSNVKLSDWKHVTVDSQNKAKEVVDYLYYQIDRYGSATVGDLFSEASIECYDPTVTKWGWNEIHDATWVGLLNGRWKIILSPPPVPLERDTK